MNAPDHNHPPAIPLMHRPNAAAKRINSSRTVIFELMRSGELPSVKLGKSRLITERALVEFVQRLEAEARES